MNKMNLLIIDAGTGTQFNGSIDWEITHVVSAEVAVEKMQNRDFDLIAIENAIESRAVAMIQKIAALQQPDAIVMRYDQEAMLVNKAAALLQNRKSERRYSFSIQDNAFRGHPLYSNDTK